MKITESILHLHPPASQAVLFKGVNPLKEQILPLTFNDHSIAVSGSSRFQCRCRPEIFNFVNRKDSAILPDDGLRHNHTCLVEERIDLNKYAFRMGDMGPA